MQSRIEMLQRALLGFVLLVHVTGCVETPGSTGAPGVRVESLLSRLETAECSSPSNQAKAVEIGGQERAAIFAHAPSTVRFRDLRLGRDPVLRFGIGIQPAGVPSDGVAFSIVLSTRREEHEVWRRELIPSIDGSRWIDIALSLDDFAGELVDLALVTRIRNGADADLSAWSAPLLEDGWSKHTLHPSVPIRSWQLARRLDVNSAERVRIGANEILDIAAEATVRGTRPISPAPPVTFRVLADGEVLFERNLRATIHVNSFSDSISVADYAGRTVDLRFEIEAPQGIAGLEAKWLQAAVMRQREGPRRAAGDRPNLLIVVVDTLRSDHIGAYGYPRATSPHLDKLAAEGVLFEQAISQSSWTMPATASLLTGLYPTEHQVSDGQPVALELETAAERAQALGMTTLAISANPIVGRAEGFAQGHERFVHLPWARAESVNSLLVQLLTEAAASRWYAYVHYIDPHDPYAAPEPFGSRFQGTYRSPFAEKPDFTSLVEAVNFGRGQVDYEERDLEYLRAAYDGEISYWDEQFGRLHDQLTELGLLRNTIIVLTSDHGEEFLEHGRIKHGLHLYDESVHVPLMIYAPELYPPASTHQLVETRRVADLARRFMGGEVPTSDELIDILRPPRGITFSHSTHGLLGPGLGRTPLAAIRDERWKLIDYPRAERRELYALTRDAYERENLVETEPKTAAEYFDILQRWLATTSEDPITVPAPANEEILEKLRSLGYIQ